MIKNISSDEISLLMEGKRKLITVLKTQNQLIKMKGNEILTFRK